MATTATTADQYLNELPEERKIPMQELRTTVLENLPAGFKEVIAYGMLGYVVPHSIYPAGYHCNPKLPLPFISLGAQKNYIAFHHLGIYSMPALLNWFVAAYSSNNLGKLDMGKGCIRFKKPGQIPYALIGELCRKVTVEEWINHYESVYKK